MIDFSPLLTSLASAEHPALRAWAEQLPAQLAQGLSAERWGDLPDWQATLAQLPSLEPSRVDLQTAVSVGDAGDCDEQTRQQLHSALMGLHPWRKGPYQLFGLTIYTEWRSDWKWDRVLPHLAPLKNRLVLDVGCGNGYHCWRMLGAGAQRVIGIDPSAKFVCQFSVLKHYLGNFPVDVLPLGIEQLPTDMQCFDSVFSMGVLYHRRSPMDHLKELKECLRPGGQLILETLIIQGGPGEVLVPEGRYAKMRNVWFLPSPDTLLSWLRKCGFKNPRMVDCTRTTPGEQRSTAWMTYESLPDFLDPADQTRTVEGHPGPIRAVFVTES
ncbi:tRNA 5-methoxyuridine(34)/uridine 5-oxyacetic acid(34) synthase CmoB [Porticoccus sp.]|uniref:tRNA 5-methoxyuridine(34)/uridine 5-oxyacetic acid(34) synthase CmoB n=1 Tax=Porticoccus sp. TaxID=2024853 RepID=UPI003F69742F